ncbi:hypothetical protein CYMTET_14023 [Cymbomonas tetramitiformis]|uniref:Uncharacterized protein n=1 Tax=Cymbomonas tetramitiformis TaxID=36881 RepID=A0AAE0GH97_9CHLO|nr:hypothetical protein CYMTET_14023 [Cymbomonas tetramitiformis]
MRWGTEEIMGDVETKQRCLDFVQSLRPNANAATYSAQGACYAEFNATYINSGLYNCSWCPTYQSCLLHIDEKPLPSPPPETSSDEPSTDLLILGAAGIFILMLAAGVAARVVWKRREELMQHEANLPEILPKAPEWEEPTVVGWITGKAQQREQERRQEELRFQEKEEQRLREAEQWKEEELQRIQETEQRVQEGWAQREADDQRQRDEARQQQVEENRQEVADRWEEYKQFRRKQVQNAEMQVEQLRGRETDSRKTIRERLGNERGLQDMVRVEEEEWEAHRSEKIMAQFHREAAQLEHERAQRQVDHALAELHEQMARQPGTLNIPDFPER